MPRKATDATIELKPAQEAALEALLLGDSITGAAAAAGVDRSTIHRWKKEPEFIAAFNRARKEQVDAFACRLWKLSEKAFSTLETALDSGDVRAAMTVIREFGRLPTDIGSADPAKVRQDQMFDEFAILSRRGGNAEK